MNNELAFVYLMQGAAVLITSGLLVAILRKAGFGWLWSLLGLAPVVGTLLNTAILYYGIGTFGLAIGLSLILGLLPLLLLAFGNWPRLAARYSPSETFQ